MLSLGEVDGDRRAVAWYDGGVAPGVLVASGDRELEGASGGVTRVERAGCKPPAQPTLVRTRHLPPPAETARALYVCCVAGRFLLAPRRDAE